MISLEPGLYQFAGIPGYPPGLYRLLAVGQHVRTFQRLVCYEDTVGGQVFMAPLDDWERYFKAMTPTPEEANEVPVEMRLPKERVVGKSDSAWGRA